MWWLLLPTYCFQTEAKLSTRNLKGVNINPDCLPTQGFDFETSCKFPKVPHLPVSWLCEFPWVSGIHVLIFKSICLTQPTPEIQSMGFLSTPSTPPPPLPVLLSPVLESAGIRNCDPQLSKTQWNQFDLELQFQQINQRSSQRSYPELPVLCWFLEGTPSVVWKFSKTPDLMVSLFLNVFWRPGIGCSLILKFIKNHEPHVITKSRIHPPTFGFLFFFSPKKIKIKITIANFIQNSGWHGEWRLIICSLQHSPSFDCIKRLLFS